MHPLDRFNADLLVDNMADNMKIRDGGATAAFTSAADLPHMNVSNGYSLLQSHPRSLQQQTTPTTPPTAPYNVQQQQQQRLTNGSSQPPPYTLANLQVKVKSNQT